MMMILSTCLMNGKTPAYQVIKVLLAAGVVVALPPPRRMQPVQRLQVAIELHRLVNSIYSCNGLSSIVDCFAFLAGTAGSFEHVPQPQRYMLFFS